MRSKTGNGQARDGNSATAAKQTGKGTATRSHHTNFGGIHHRRDKRYPFREGPLRPEDIAEVEAFESRNGEDSGETEARIPEWSEALMLWLSWNSTYEKLTARMCKPGQDSRKIEALMDEMDQLRSRAIQVSEGLLAQ